MLRTAVLALFLASLLPGWGPVDRCPQAEPLPGDCRRFPIVSGQAAGSVDSGSSGLTIVSLNMARETKAVRILAGLSELESQRAPDIFLLQEVQEPSAGTGNAAAELAERLRFNYAYQPANLWKDGTREGLAIVSRYPLSDLCVMHLPAVDLVVKNRCRIALSASVLTPLGQVRLFNLHLDSRIGIEERLKQVSPVATVAQAVPGPCVVGGDFNSSNLRWLGRLMPVLSDDQEIRVRRYFEDKGFRTPFVEGQATFDHLGLRLDSIYVRGLGWTAHGVEEINFSDHRAIWVMLRPEETPPSPAEQPRPVE